MICMFGGGVGFGYLMGWTAGANKAMRRKQPVPQPGTRTRTILEDPFLLHEDYEEHPDDIERVQYFASAPHAPGSSARPGLQSLG
jgi:hypothetical protein